MFMNGNRVVVGRERERATVGVESQSQRSAADKA